MKIMKDMEETFKVGLNKGLRIDVNRWKEALFMQGIGPEAQGDHRFHGEELQRGVVLLQRRPSKASS